MPGLLDPTEDVISPEERRAIAQQNLFSTLLQGGMQLVAGGENLYPWQRAQMIGQAAQTFGGMPAQQQQMLANAAQQKLVSQKYADKKREGEILGSEDFKAAIAKMPPEMQALARVNPQAAISAVSNWRQMQMQDQRERAAADREAARQAALDARQQPKVEKDEYGRPIAYDPKTGSWSLINVGGTDMRSAYGVPGGQPGVQGNQAPANNVTVPLDDTADYTKAFGTSGWYHKMANTVRGAIDGPTDENARAANAQNNYNQVYLGALKSLSTEVPGRNSKYAAQIVGETLPKPGEFWTSPEEAISKIKAAQNQIQGEIDSAQNAFDSPGNIQQRGKIAENIRDMTRVRDNLQAIAERIKPAPVNKTAGNSGGLPDGAAVVGKTQDGRTVYSLNGKQYVK